MLVLTLLIIKKVKLIFGHPAFTKNVRKLENIGIERS